MTGSELDSLAKLLADRLSIQPRWLKLKQAASYSSIGQNRLVKLAQKGKVLGFQDTDSKRKDWVFDKNSIDDYRFKQSVSNLNYTKIALEIVDSLGV